MFGAQVLDGTVSSAILPAVEQRTDHLVPPVTAAGMDPAYIPGLTPPPKQPTAPAKAPDRPGADAETESPPSADAARSTERESVQEGVRGTLADVVGDDEGDEAESLPEPDDGPVFEASDHRSSIVADHVGITLTLDGESAEFRWPEIGAVEIGTSRFGKRLDVTVHTVKRRSYQGDVGAPSRAALKRWTAELDAVLDVRFDDGEPEKDTEGAEVTEGAEAADVAGATGEAGVADVAEVPEVAGEAGDTEDTPAGPRA